VFDYPFAFDTVVQQLEQDEFVLQVFILRNGEDASVKSLGMRPLGRRNPEIMLTPMDMRKLLFNIQPECPHYLLAKHIDPDTSPITSALGYSCWGHSLSYSKKSGVQIIRHTSRIFILKHLKIR
jgi:hypothetical protein